MFNPIFHHVLLGKLRDITFIISTYLSYFLRKELEVPPLVKLLVMVFVLEYKVLSAIFGGKMEGVRVKKV